MFFCYLGELTRRMSHIHIFLVVYLTALPDTVHWFSCLLYTAKMCLGFIYVRDNPRVLEAESSAVFE